MISESRSEIMLYQAEDNRTRIEVRLENETVWLTQAQMVELFQTTKQNVSLHIQNIFAEKELDRRATVKEYLTVQQEGGREVSRNLEYYNLDAFLRAGDRDILEHAGTISAEEAKQTAELEFEKFDRQRRQLEDAQADAQFLQGVENLAKKVKQLKPPKRKK